MPIDAVRKSAEARYYSGMPLPQTQADVIEFLRYIGVHPLQSAIDAQWKKLQRRQVGGAASGTSSASIIPFADILSIAIVCYNENAKVDPLVAEDQEYFADAWMLCGGGADATGSVPASTLVALLAEVGLDDDVISTQRRQLAVSNRVRRGSHAEGDQMTYKDFVELATPAIPQHDSDAHKAAAIYDHSNEGDDSYSRPRLSLSMMMRVKQMIRNFKRRREARLDKERRERELHAYARKYFGTNLFAPEGSVVEPLPAATPKPGSVAPASSKLQAAPSVGVFGPEDSVALLPRSNGTFVKSKTPTPVKQRAVAGGGLSAVRAARAGSSSDLPPLIDDSQSAFDKALLAHEANARRIAKERHEAKLKRLQKSHPHSGGVDVVRTYVQSPIPVPLKERLLERSKSPIKCQTMGRPKPSPLSPTQLRQKRV